MHYPYCVFRSAISLSLAILLVIIGNSVTVNAQNFATTRTSSGMIGYGIVAGLLTGAAPTTDTSYASVRDTAFITDASYTNAATLTAKCFNILVVGHAGEAWVEPKFPTPMTSGATAYFRIDLPTSSGLSVDVLSTVGALTNLFTNNLIIVSAYGGATDVDTGARISDAKVSKALVKDTAGNYYIAVTADSTFNAARIGLRFNTGLLGVTVGASLSMKVYYGLNYAVAPCDGRAAYTDMGTSSGLTVLVLDSVVKNPVNAIDNDKTTFSKLGGSSLLSVGVASTVAQSFYFKVPAPDHIKLTLSTPGTILDLGLANSINVAAYKGDTLRSSQSLGSLLSLDLLFLLSSSSGFPVYINPGGTFDKVIVTYNHLVGASLIGNGINIYDIRAVPPKPVLSKDTATIYQFTAPIISATSLTGDDIKWFNPLYADMGTGGAFPTTIDTISTSATYYAQASRTPCSNLSDTAKVYIKVVTLTHTDPVVGTRGVLYASLVHSTPGAGIGAAGFRYTLASGSVLPSGLTLNSNGTITGTSTVTDTMAFTTLLRDTLNNLDAGTHAFNLIIRAPLVLPPMTLPGAATGVFYTTTLPPAQGGTGSYTYSLSSTTPLPSGLSYDSTTGVVSGTTAIGTYPILINVSDDEGRTASQTYSLIVAAALPVYIVAFTGNVHNGSAILQWQTANENDIYDMQLQKSKDGLSWNTIYKTTAKNGASTYSYSDPVNDSAVVLYRLLVSLYNDNPYYSQVLRLMAGQKMAQNHFIIYPNPACSGCVLNFMYNGKGVALKAIQVYNNNGLLIRSATGNMTTWTLDNLPAGIYVLKVITVDEQEFETVLNIQ